MTTLTPWQRERVDLAMARARELLAAGDHDESVDRAFLRRVRRRAADPLFDIERGLDDLASKLRSIDEWQAKVDAAYASGRGGLF